MCSHEDTQANRQQSPIDITGYTVGGSPQLSFEYGGNADLLANTGEFVKAIYEDGGGILLEDGEYRLVEAHAHNPSEHTVDGRRFALEMHLVHRRGMEIAVIGILYRLGEPNAAIEEMIEAAPGQGEADVTASAMPASNFLPQGRAYYAYTGSLTTPPYTEGVRWHVMSEALEVSAEQVERLAALTGGGENSRGDAGAERAGDSGLSAMMTKGWLDAVGVDGERDYYQVLVRIGTG